MPSNRRQMCREAMGCATKAVSPASGCGKLSNILKHHNGVSWLVQGFGIVSSFLKIIQAPWVDGVGRYCVCFFLMHFFSKFVFCFFQVFIFFQHIFPVISCMFQDLFWNDFGVKSKSLSHYYHISWSIEWPIKTQLKNIAQTIFQGDSPWATRISNSMLVVGVFYCVQLLFWWTCS